MSAREFIERVEALAGAATEGEWWHTGKAATVYGRWADDLSSAPHVANVHDPDDATFIAASRTVVPQLTAALRAVLDLHVPYAGDLSRNKFCRECEDIRPCPTVRAITDALGGEQA